MKNTAKLSVVYGDVVLGVHGENFSYLFSYAAGGLESLKVNQREWIYRPIKPTFWRALTDNDRGSQFHLKSGMWLSADQFTQCVAIKVVADNQDQTAVATAPANNQFQETQDVDTLAITYTYETITVPKTTTEITYTVRPDGKIKVTAHYHGQPSLPELPVFGIRLVMPTLATGFTYDGLSGETYPDRKQGGKPGQYHVTGLPVAPYLVPQDSGMHMETNWVEVVRDTQLDNKAIQRAAASLRVQAIDTPFHFSCVPYTPLELESATHQEELPLARRTVLSLYRAVRGVGGIDSWGSDVLPDYRVSAQEDHILEVELSFPEK